MGRIPRSALWAVGLVGTFVAAGMVVALSTDLDRFRGSAEASLGAALGRTVTIAGHVSWAWALRPTIALGDVRVAAGGAGSDDVLRAERVELTVTLPSLLRRSPRVVALALEGAFLRLEGTAAAEGGPSVFTGTSVDLESLAISRSVLTYRDAASGTRTEVAVAEGELTSPARGPLQLHLVGAFRNVPFTGDATGGTLVALASGVEPWPVTLALEVAGTTIDATGTLDRTPAGARLELPSFAARSPVADLRGHVTIGVADGRPRLEGTLATQRFGWGDRGSTASAEGAPASRLEAWPIPVEALRAVDADLALDVAALEVGALDGRLAATAALCDGHLDLHLRLTDAAHTASATVALDARATPARVEIVSTAHGRSLTRLLEESGVPRAVAAAIASARGELRARGTTLGDLLAAAEVKVVFLATTPTGTGPATRSPPRLVTASLTPAHDGVRLDLHGTYGTTPVTLQIDGPALARGVGPGPWPIAARVADVDLSARLTRTRGGLALRMLTARRGTNELRGELDLGLAGTRPTLRGTLAGTTIALPPSDLHAPWLADLLPSGETLRVVDAEIALTIGELTGASTPVRDLAVTIVAGDGRLTLAPLRARLADETLSASVTLEGATSDTRPRLTGRATLSGYPTDGTPAHTTGTATPSPSTAVAGALAIPGALLRGLDVQAELAVERIRSTTGEIGNLTVNVTLAQERLVAPLRGTLWDGAVSGTVAIDAGREPAVVTLGLAARGIALSRLLAALGSGQEGDPRIDVTLELGAAGPTLGDVWAHARGRIDADAGAGSIASRDFDLWATDLVRSLLPGVRRDERMQLNCAVARFDVVDGKARTRGLLVDGARMTVAGAGTINLVSGAIKLVLTPKPKNAGLVNLATPVQLVGTLAHPHASVDTIGLAKGIPGDLLAGALDPRALLERFGSTGTRSANPCAAALEGSATATSESGLRAPAVVERGRDVLRDLGRTLGDVLPGK